MRLILIYVIILLPIVSCGSREDRLGGTKQNQQTDKPAAVSKEILPSPKGKSLIPKVTFFIENSGSMKGYVNGSSNYIDVLANLANQPDLIRDNISRVFYLANGQSTPNRVTNLRQSLMPANFNQSQSDLNNLFKIALDSTNASSVTILVSDGIYDMCPDPNPLSTLSILGRDLRSVFINKLVVCDFQTIVIKCKSNFNGRFFPGNCCSAYQINQDRPYYIWIFGETEFLTKYFSDQYLQGLNGYENSARFFKFNSSADIFKPNSHRIIGSYYPSNNNRNILENVESNSANVFQFSIAVDYSDLPLSEEYLSEKSNYRCSNGFEIVSIDKPTNVSKLGFPNQTHLIVVKKTGNPIGTLTVSLLNKGYPWISSTNISSDCNIAGNSNQTFGFMVLNQGIIEAYNNFNNANEICIFSIILNN